MSKTPRKLQGLDAVPPSGLPACGFTRGYMTHATLERTYGRRSPGNPAIRGRKFPCPPSSNDAGMIPSRRSPSPPAELHGWVQQDTSDVSFSDLISHGEGNVSPSALHTSETAMYNFSDNWRLDQTMDPPTDFGCGGDFEVPADSPQSWHPYTAMMWREDDPGDGPWKAMPPENANLYALSDTARGISLALVEAVASKDVARIRELLPRSIKDSKLTQRARAVMASWDKSVIELLRCQKHIQCTLSGRNYAGKVASILAQWPLAYRVTEPPEISSLLRVARHYDNELGKVKSAAHAFDYDELGKLLREWPFAADAVAHQQGIYDRMSEDMHQATVILETKDASGAEEMITKLKVLAPSRHLWQMRGLQELVARREVLEQSLKAAQAGPCRDALQAAVESWPLAPTPVYQAARKQWVIIRELVQKAMQAARGRDGDSLQRCLQMGPYQHFMNRAADAQGHTLMGEWDILESYLGDKRQLEDACDQTGDKAIDDLLQLLQTWSWRKQYVYDKARNIADIYRQGKLQHAIILGNLEVIQKEMAIWQKFPVLRQNYVFLTAIQQAEQGLANQELMRLLHLQATDGSIIALFNRSSKPKPDILTCDERGNRPLHYASNVVVAQFLLEQDRSAQAEGKRSIMAKNTAGCPALHQVARNLVEKNAARGEREAARSLCEMLLGLKIPLSSLPRDKALETLVHIAQLPDRWAQMQILMDPPSLTSFTKEVARFEKGYELVEPWLITIEKKCLADKMHLCAALGVVKRLWEWMHDCYKAAFTSGHEGESVKKSKHDAEVAASHCRDLLNAITLAAKTGDRQAKAAQRLSVRGDGEVREACQHFTQSVRSFQHDLAEWQFIALYRTVSFGTGKHPVGQWLRSMPDEGSSYMWLQEPVTTLLETHRLRSNMESNRAWERIRTCVALRADVPRLTGSWPEFLPTPRTQLGVLREILKFQELSSRDTPVPTWSLQDELLRSKKTHDEVRELERSAFRGTQDLMNLGIDIGVLASSSLWYYNLLKLHADSAYDMLEASFSSANLSSNFEFKRGGLDMNQSWQRLVGEGQLLDHIAKATSKDCRSGTLQSELESSLLCISDVLACKLVAAAEDLRKIFISLSCCSDPANQDERSRLELAKQKWEMDGVMLIRVQNGYHKSCSAFATDHNLLLHVALRLDLVDGISHVIRERRRDSGEACDIEQTQLALLVELLLVTPETEKLMSAVDVGTNVSNGQYDIFDVVTSSADDQPATSGRDEQTFNEILQAATDQDLASWERLLTQQRPEKQSAEEGEDEEEEDRLSQLREAHRRAAGKVLNELKAGRRYPLPAAGVQATTQMLDGATQTEGDPAFHHPDFQRYAKAVRQAVSSLSELGERVWEASEEVRDVDATIEKTSCAIGKIKELYEEKEKRAALLAEQLEEALQELKVLRKQTLEVGSCVEAESEGQWLKGTIVELPAMHRITVGPEDWKELFEWTLPDWEQDILSKLVNLENFAVTCAKGETVNFVDAIRNEIKADNCSSSASLPKDSFPLSLRCEISEGDWDKAMVRRPAPWEAALMAKAFKLQDYHLTKSNGQAIDLASIRKMLKSKTSYDLPAKAFPLVLTRKLEGAWEVQPEDTAPGETSMCTQVRPPSKLEASVQTTDSAVRVPSRMSKTRKA
eukprot:TRINITY_DN27099_c0_g1_i1.p1 TRINITY_DN27099_c0_g1~~TRINITY_DN27099_c0_g1_i1.p1  ORF type:complete len:1644 (-),score=284.81 TRINITY_DN27099_c0_g1_i1:244-5175(-)